MKATPSSTDRQARIREIAHSIWESEGRPAGQQMRHWLMAEKLVLAEEKHASQRGEEQKKPKK
ncbi:DUF2934 domain-containing protein [Dyella flagellata]|uniref:DUF2934 domain-containing protein n=1 Tax=Dyella flagellata TaxID=1867833 RepID=A0ABQ5XAA1_9GAMM|nr:DUF2934 domain-containing protein [Dyella flagellata]GLQ87465.1 hypothetical protein GCM10007898_10310 [Dyella flagellata]